MAKHVLSWTEKAQKPTCTHNDIDVFYTHVQVHMFTCTHAVYTHEAACTSANTHSLLILFLAYCVLTPAAGQVTCSL